MTSPPDEDEKTEGASPEDEPEIQQTQEGPDEDSPPRDVLGEAAAKAGLEPEVVEALTHWLAVELSGDRFARLEQAGGGGEGGIPLARVFVDLEVSKTPMPEVSDLEARWPFVRMMLEQRPQRLAERATRLHAASLGGGASSLDEDVHVEGQEDPQRQPSGVVVIGGPGQGKSTVGQLLCQLHRAALLAPREEMLREQGKRDALEAFGGAEARRTLGRPVEACFPVRVVLADAAAWLAAQGGDAEAKGEREEGPPRLLRYLAEKARGQAGQEIAPEVLERLLVACPSLVVLDGLDEVPASGDRQRTLAAIRELLAYLIRGGAHGLVVATTRPQGYSGELDALGIATVTHHLVPLSKKRALAYAERLAETRFGDPPDRKRKVLQRLKLAAKEEATARLMRSPLQVTILATLVDRIGRAPSERWSLFSDYYRVIYEREMERLDIPEVADLLRNYRSYIDRIHANVGLMLQVEAEHAGGAGAAMSKERLLQVIDAALAEDEIEQEKRKDLGRQIVKAASDRLVLLVEVQRGRYGFEIRSLQEFMAASALASRGEALLEERLAQIVKASSFRNVVLFLASKCFTELSDLREAFTERICPGLNEDPDDELSRVTRAGSVLALEILEDGTALTQPKYARRLTETAVGVLDLPSVELQVRFAQVVPGEAMEANAEARSIYELNRILPAFSSTRIDVRANGQATPFFLFVNTIDTNRHGWNRLIVVVSQPSTASSIPLVAAARFALAPSATSLSSALAQIAQYYNAEVKRWVARRAPWPLGACLGAADSPDELTELSHRAAAGEFGDLEDWYKAEAHRVTNGADLDSLADISPEDWPTSPTIAALCISALVVPVAFPFGTNIRERATVLTPLRRVFRTSGIRWLRRWAAGWMTNYLYEVSEYWRTLADPLARELFAGHEPRAIWSEFDRDEEDLTRPDPARFEHARARHVASILLRVCDDLEEDEALATAAELARVSPLGARLSLDTSVIFGIHPFAPRAAERFALHLRKQTPHDNWELTARLHKTLTRLMATRKSGLDDPATWHRLRLPLPPPLQRLDLTGPFHLRRIQVQHIRAITAADWQLPRGVQGPGWHLILGGNGAGKTSLLRAIALALVGPTTAATLRQPWKDWLPPEAPKASIDLTLAQEVEVRPGVLQDAPLFLGLDITRTGADAKLVERTDSSRSQWDDAPRAFSAAYGPFRRFTDRDDEYESLFASHPRLVRHISLFDSRISLAECLSWLTGLRAKELEDQIPSPILGPLKHLAGAAGPIFFLPHGAHIAEVKVDKVTFVDGNGVEIPVESLSDGYRAVLSLTFDLIRHLAESFGHDKIFDSKDPTLVLPGGIVLIDEIDVHLDATWQRQIGHWFKKHFPNIQFLVTTHSPLVCQAADSVFLLPTPGSDEEPRMVEGVDLDRLRHGNVLEAYGTEVFGRGVTRSEESKKMLRRLAELNRKELDEGLSAEEQEGARVRRHR